MKTIPESFRVLGHEIRVEWCSDLADSTGCVGLCNYAENKIQLQPSTKDFRIAKSNILQTFWHEFFHMALYHLGRKLCHDEELVDQLGQVVHQFNTTRAGKLPPP